MRLALVLPLAAALACSRGPASVHVTSVRVDGDGAADALSEAGLDPAALESAAREGLRAAGFHVGEGAHPHRARISVASVRLAPPGAEGSAPRVEVSVEIELAPAEPGKGGAMRETGTAAAALEAGEPRSAWIAALAGASREAADSLALAFVEDAKSVDALVADLAAKDPRVRVHAIRALAERKAAAAVPALVERLADGDPRVVHRTVGALAQIGDERAVPALIDLSRSGDGATTARLARIIGDIGGAEAQGYLLTLASGHSDARVRRAAQEALAEMRARADQARVAARN